MKLLTKKSQKEVLGRLIANHIIAQTAIDKSNLETKEYRDFTTHLIENTLEIAECIGGINAMYGVHREIERRMKK